MDKVFLSYNDSIIYESDLKLLDTNNWLNDRLIGFVYEYLEKETFNSECNQKNYFAFVNPSTVQYLKLCSSLDEAKMCFLDPLELDKKDILFLPLNDNQNEESAGGSHWSLLVIDRKKLGCMHFDSTGSNHKEAQYFYNKYKSYFGVNKFEVSTNFPKQTNSSDCGVYALTASEVLANHYKASQNLNASFNLITPDYIKQLRKKYKDLVLSLSAKL